MYIIDVNMSVSFRATPSPKKNASPREAAYRCGLSESYCRCKKVQTQNHAPSHTNVCKSFNKFILQNVARKQVQCQRFQHHFFNGLIPCDSYPNPPFPVLQQFASSLHRRRTPTLQHLGLLSPRWILVKKNWWKSKMPSKPGKPYLLHTSNNHWSGICLDLSFHHLIHAIHWTFQTLVICCCSPWFLYMLIYPFIEKCTSKQGSFDHLHLDFPTNWHHVSAVSGFRLHHKATKDPAQKVPSSIIPTFSNNARPQQQIQHVKKQNEITR